MGFRAARWRKLSPTRRPYRQLVRLFGARHRRCCAWRWRSRANGPLEDSPRGASNPRASRAGRHLCFLERRRVTLQLTERAACRQNKSGRTPFSRLARSQGPRKRSYLRRAAPIRGSRLRTYVFDFAFFFFFFFAMTVFLDVRG